MTDWKAEHDAELMLRREWSARAQKAEAENVSLRAERDHWKQVAESHSASIDDHCREIERLRSSLRECADDLENEIESRYNGIKDHPAMAPKYERDIEPVTRARSLLD